MKEKPKNTTSEPTMAWGRFDGQTLRPELICRCTNEGMDLSSSWLIIYPADFMALINFPHLPFLSLYLPLKVWSQAASGADNAGVWAASQAPLEPAARTSTREKELLSYALAW